MRLALCNEVLGDMPFGEQCRFAASLGYDGLELAPFTVGDAPHALPRQVIAALRREAHDAGIAITGLHWLMVTPPGLSITTEDDGAWQATMEVGRGLVLLCAELGGSVLVHGSPKQRQLPDEPVAREAARSRARDYFERMARAAEDAGVTYCVEPLGPAETNYLNTVSETAALVDEIGSPGLRTMIDTKAALQTEEIPVPDLIDTWLPTGSIAHIQVNDADGSAPGQGTTAFGPILAALARNGYDGTVAVEPFVYEPTGPAVAARAIGYLKGILEGLPAEVRI